MVPFLTIVAAGVLFSADGQSVLLSQRKKGAHLEHLWELPGGKVEAGESPQIALVRELREELGIHVLVGAPIEVTHHVYAKPESQPGGQIQLLLLFFEVTLHAESPAPTPVDVAAICWATREDLDVLPFPAGDLPVVARIARRLELTRDALSGRGCQESDGPLHQHPSPHQFVVGSPLP